MQASDTPRPEYPRPQFVRERWLNLNGTWEFEFDDAGSGLSDRWFDGRHLVRSILVPFPYQSELSGVNDKGIHEVVWYARSFIVPDDWRDCDILLHFGAVDYKAVVWVNGAEVGHNRGGHVPFSFNIRPYLRKGENRVTLRVEDKQDARQPRGKQSPTGIPGGIDYYCTTGIWQTVWLEPVPALRISDVAITPDLAGGLLELAVHLHAPAIGWQVRVTVLDGTDVTAAVESRTSLAVARLRLEIPRPKPWSPENPHLYDVVVELVSEDGVIDRVTSYAGFRSIEIRDGWIVLNGTPVYLAMVLDQGYWPESLLAPPSDAHLRRDVELVKEMGFNGVRKHQKIEDPRWLYWCDRLGLLVWGEMANARAWSIEAEEQLLAEWYRAVRRDYNHPCIITWVPVNESMGFPELEVSHPGQYAFLERAVELTRRLDPTRPVIDNDGWEHTNITDICAIHDYTPTSEGLSGRYRAALAGGPLPPTVWYREKPLFVLGSRHRGQPVMLTEVGGFLSEPPDTPVENRDPLYEVYETISSSEELLDRYADLLEGLAELHFVTGFCYTQFADVEQEINGLLTCHRTPKVPLAEIASLHRRLLQRRGNDLRYRIETGAVPETPGQERS